ncbi:FAS1-like dehydratase domain-containing protein [Streptomyces sp. NPDC002285]|uniref:FAS1-like dehydratase domain-containing protein n=1 Tax=Streptomyces sp. NPDC056462 TaxID=3345826 RepID=UPI0036885A95
MPVTSDLVGRRYPTTAPYEVCREKIREFAAAIGDPHPAYRDAGAARALGHPDVIAPPTFVFAVVHRAMAEVRGDPAIGLDIDRVVHSDQRLEFHRPVRAGDRLTVTVHIEAARRLAGNGIVSTRSEVTTESGEPVVTAHMTLISRAPENTD